MVSVAVSKLGCSSLFFVEPGVKVDGRYYRDVLLKQQMLPVVRRIAGDTCVFQQDSAPAHCARDTVQLLQQETPEFIAPDLWLPNNPDLNPVDYHVWGLVQERVYKTAIGDTADLKQRLSEMDGQAFHRLSSTKPLTSGGYTTTSLRQSKGRLLATTSCNQPALITRATKRYHTVISSFQNHPHFIEENSYDLIRMLK